MNICCYNSKASDLQVGIVEAEHFSVDEEESVVADEETADPQNELSFKEGWWWLVEKKSSWIQFKTVFPTCQISQLREEEVKKEGEGETSHWDGDSHRVDEVLHQLRQKR